MNNNQGFLTETPTSGNGHPGLGVLEPQTGAPFSSTTLSGAYFFGDVLPVVSTSDGSGVVTITNLSGTVTQDNSDPNGTLITGQQQTFTLTLDPTVTGRVTLASPGGGSGSVLYIISPNKAVLMDLSTGDTTPTVTVIEK